MKMPSSSSDSEWPARVGAEGSWCALEGLGLGGPYSAPPPSGPASCQWALLTPGHRVTSEMSPVPCSLTLGYRHTRAGPVARPSARVRTGACVWLLVPGGVGEEGLPAPWLG